MSRKCTCIRCKAEAFVRGNADAIINLHEFSMASTEKRIEVIKLLHEFRNEGETTGDVFLRGLRALKALPNVEHVRDEWCAEYAAMRDRLVGQKPND